MYVLILLLVPILFLFNTYLAMGGLAVGIAAMYIERTRPAKRRRSRHDSGSECTAGYEN